MKVEIKESCSQETTACILIIMRKIFSKKEKYVPLPMVSKAMENQRTDLQQDKWNTGIAYPKPTFF